MCIRDRIISEQKEEVHKQKAIIEEHQKETIDSINYAKKIQYALLAQEDLLLSLIHISEPTRPY